MSIPKAFISYSYDDSVHQDWVLRLATRLRTDGIDVTLDLWHLAFGDQLPLFMERAVRENQFVLIASDLALVNYLVKWQYSNQ